MRQHTPHKEAAHKTFMSSVELLANVIAFIAAIFGTPLLYNNSIGLVQNFVFEQYGAGLQDIVMIVWAAVCGLIVFAFARASIATALMIGGAALAARLLV